MKPETLEQKGLREAFLQHTSNQHTTIETITSWAKRKWHGIEEGEDLEKWTIRDGAKILTYRRVISDDLDQIHDVKVTELHTDAILHEALYETFIDDPCTTTRTAIEYPFSPFRWMRHGVKPGEYLATQEYRNGDLVMRVRSALRDALGDRKFQSRIIDVKITDTKHGASNSSIINEVDELKGVLKAMNPGRQLGKRKD